MLQHGQRVMDVIDRVVDRLDSQEKLWDLLIAIGREHFSKQLYHISIGIFAILFWQCKIQELSLKPPPDPSEIFFIIPSLLGLLKFWEQLQKNKFVFGSTEIQHI